jgi:tRNA-Thr(GGU) m(6)t(6)A37 methyltransferase TsaA
VDAGNLGHVGISHAGEMLFKLAFRYPGVLRAGVASEPANHEFLDLRLDDIAPVNAETGLRDIEELQLQDPAWVRERINLSVARQRIAPIDVPILVMGRDGDHLQGIFRLSYELLEEAGKEAEWVSWDHPLHGYLFPLAADGATGPDQVQQHAIDVVIAFLDRHMKPDLTAGARVAADRAVQPTHRYEVRPVAWVESPLKHRAQAPRQGSEGAPPAWLVFEPEVAEAVRDLRAGQQIIVLTWLDRAQRDELSTVPGDNPSSPPLGLFSTRSPDRPNPIGLHRTEILAVEGLRILVSELEALDRTPVVDIKPALDPVAER